VRPARAKSIALDLSQDLSVEERGSANRAPAVLQVANAADPFNVLRLRTCDLFAEKRTPVSVTQRGWAFRGSRVKPATLQRGACHVHPPVCEVLVDVAQDVGALHGGAERARGSISGITMRLGDT
jgi:hypothetical protein